MKNFNLAAIPNWAQFVLKSAYNAFVNDVAGAILALQQAQAAQQGVLDNLGNAATKDVGTTAGTVAAGDDSRVVGALQKVTQLESSTGDVRDGSAFATRWVDATDATRTSEVAIQTVMNGGALTDRVKFGGARTFQVLADDSGNGQRVSDASGTNYFDVQIGGALTRFIMSGPRKFYINVNGVDAIAVDETGVPVFGSSESGNLPYRVNVNSAGTGFRIGDESDTNYLDFISGGVESRFDTTGERPLIFRINGNDPLTLGSGNKIGFLGAAPVGAQSIPTTATDPATTMALANALRGALINLGLAS